jgi:hypothetical protein
MSQFGNEVKLKSGTVNAAHARLEGFAILLR